MLLILAGILVVAVTRAPDVPPRVASWVVAGMAGFWIVGAAYEILAPFPVPVAWWALPTFSILVALALIAGQWLRRDPAATGRP